VKVILAGYNVDAEVIAELTCNKNRQDVTPETLSASYARISRDPRPINELRQLARQEVEKARHSNSNIIFKMGHHSVAEHAVFNFDLIDVSRYALEEVEKFRLCSYTEKSQRYQKLEGNYILPDEIKTLGLEKRFVETIDRQNAYYQQLVEKGIEPEDARYATSMATGGQVGLTINARNLELLIRRFASHPLQEVQQLGRQLFEVASKIAPSIILFTAANDFDQKTYPALEEFFKGKWERKRKISKAVELVEYTAKADIKLVAALLHTASGISYRNCLRTVRDLTQRERLAAVKTALSELQFYDSVQREFEHITLTYDLVMSSGCFAQMKRHRMATLTSQKYDPALGVTIPPKIIAAGEEKQFLSIMQAAEKLAAELPPAVAPYILTGAHRKRSLMTLNVRELYHLSRLREDQHAQWDIQLLTAEMTKQASSVMPLALLLIGGKDSYPAKFQSVFGRQPKIMPPA